MKKAVELFEAGIRIKKEIYLHPELQAIFQRNPWQVDGKKLRDIPSEDQFFEVWCKGAKKNKLMKFTPGPQKL